FLGIVEYVAESSVGVEINPGNANFLDAQTQSRCLHPELERHAPSCFGNPQVSQDFAAIRFESAESVREIEMKTPFQLLGNLPVDPTTVLGCRRILAEVPKVTASGNDIGIVNRFQQDRNTGRFMLTVAIHGDQH